jgi:hypothetical protein
VVPIGQEHHWLAIDVVAFREKAVAVRIPGDVENNSRVSASVSRFMTNHFLQSAQKTSTSLASAIKGW